MNKMSVLEYTADFFFSGHIWKGLLENQNLRAKKYNPIDNIYSVLYN